MASYNSENTSFLEANTKRLFIPLFRCNPRSPKMEKGDISYVNDTKEIKWMELGYGFMDGIKYAVFTEVYESILTLNEFQEFICFHK